MKKVSGIVLLIVAAGIIFGLIAKESDLRTAVITFSFTVLIVFIIGIAAYLLATDKKQPH